MPKVSLNNPNTGINGLRRPKPRPSIPQVQVEALANNQYIIDYGDKIGFQSYATLVAIAEKSGGKVKVSAHPEILDQSSLVSSNTTRKHFYRFLESKVLNKPVNSVNKKSLLELIKAGIVTLDLDSQSVDDLVRVDTDFSSPNQFAVLVGDQVFFQSYEALVAFIDTSTIIEGHPSAVVDTNALNYSKTTSRHLYRFLKRYAGFDELNKKKVEDLIDAGLIGVADLN